MIKCIRLHEHRKGTLRAFVDLELTKVGLIIRDCCWHESHGKEWISFPARPYSDPGGTARWTPLIEIRDPYLKDQFSTLAIAAIHAYLPQEGRREYGKASSPRSPASPLLSDERETSDLSDNPALEAKS